MHPRERYIKALSRTAVDRPPVWLMRQAGRYLPEYREIRSKNDFLTMCYTPELVVEVSLQPWRRFAVDAAIVFSDILLPAHAMGAELKFVEGDGPTFLHPVRTEKDLEHLNNSWVVAAERLEPVLESLKILRAELGNQAGLIGFVGSPWTIAAYLVEGRGKHGFAQLLRMKDQAPVLLQQLLTKITDVLVPYVQAQVTSGADAVQLFDTWGGLLTVQEFAQISLPHITRLLRAIQEANAKAVYFLKERTELLALMVSLSNHGQAKPDALGIGYEFELANVRKNWGKQFAVQGNFNPENLLLPLEEIKTKTQQMLLQAGSLPGYIANLGHGVIKTTQPEAVKMFVDTVHNWEVIPA